MTNSSLFLLSYCLLVCSLSAIHGFTAPQAIFTLQKARSSHGARPSLLRMSEPERSIVQDPMEEAMMENQNSEAARQLEKQRRAQLLREQEVFMKKSTGIYKCSNCDWQYDETKGDVMMIGGMVKPGTAFGDLASNWRCPVCRASKDNFIEVVEEIPGFEVNQGYGFGTNSWSAGQKNLAIFGGLALFFVLFLGGYALS